MLGTTMRAALQGRLELGEADDEPESEQATRLQLVCVRKLTVFVLGAMMRAALQVRLVAWRD